MVSDADYMRRALFHARRAEGVTTPNPMVGAVVVGTDGVIVGEGRHPRVGDPHAEVFALQAAGERARGATLYVNLEPCCHVGRTGPCTDRIIGAGIARVVAAMTDPNPLVSGRGFTQLRASGIQVEVGLLGEDAARLNRAFTTVQTAGRPMVTVKVATSQDGKIAAAPGVRTAITSSAANRRTQRLRGAVDAVGVGSGTVLADDPVLTARDSYRLRPLARVVFDRRLRTPSSARLFSTLAAGPVIIISTAETVAQQPGRADALRAAGATLVAGTGDLATDVRALLAWDISALLLEGGGALHAAAWRARIVDRVIVIVAPTELGEQGAKVFDGLPVPMSQLIPVRVETLGPDAWMEADVHGDR
ncbi:MAG: bifunctional diaminohydroxyphosphoribosylaminopyrimidine deaminase/5-amino-6-(5-phosphoribosylamino)uracil reductase RibD [Acidobacteriota bacterium]|nr:bifunctional diaminohydroxyphosphoribosylaminopyrimidine deaminase/5-amino-6-(5-phosphoribosylamino)uracil reductase RibD [Acidobacteriota bacterium]